MLRLRKPNTVDGVMKPLRRALDDLERIRQDHAARKNQLEAQAADLERLATEAGQEAGRADVLASKINSLIGDV